MQELIQELIEEIKRLTEQLQDQNGQLQKQSEQLTALRKEIAEKDALIVALTKRIEELTHRKNSGNSSVPPSKDGYHNNISRVEHYACSFIFDVDSLPARCERDCRTDTLFFPFRSLLTGIK